MNKPSFTYIPRQEASSARHVAVLTLVVLAVAAVIVMPLLGKL